MGSGMFGQINGLGDELGDGPGCGRADRSGRHAHRRVPILSLHGVPAGMAEPIVLMAEILGWQVRCCPAGLLVPAHLCLAPLPDQPGATSASAPALAAWSTDNNLNELISRQNASVLVQPICIHQVEQLLQTLGHDVRMARWGNRAARSGREGLWGRTDDEDSHAGHA